MATDADIDRLHRFSFGDTPAMADRLLTLVLTGRKTATCGAVRDFGPHEPIPEVGRRDVALDGRGRPAAIIETTAVSRGPIAEVDLDFVLAAGEGEASVEQWLASYRDYFSRNGGFSPDLEVIFEQFKVVAVLPRSAADD
jgi:uncharacterized protein YhfF